MVKVYNSDCTEKLKDIEDNSIDCIVTDPPYPVISGGQTKTAEKFYTGGWKNDGKIFKENDFDFTVEFLNTLYSKMKDGTHIYWFTNFLNLNKFMTLFEESNFYIHNLLVWEKQSIVNRWYMKNCEYVIFAKKGNAKSINNKGSNTVHYYDTPNKKIHPTEKPVSLLKMYIENSTKKGETVLDPFMGSGSTGEASVKSGRSFIGIEKDKDFFELADNRLKKINNKVTLF